MGRERVWHNDGEIMLFLFQFLFLGRGYNNCDTAAVLCGLVPGDVFAVSISCCCP
jgi:hypothetical protein